MDQFGLLRWTHLPLSNKVHFLDLTITIDFANKKFLFKTFQNISKPPNLYLYLPPNSAHPPGMLKSLIFGLIRKYNLQNTHAEDFSSIKNKLFSRLIARGHKHNDILPIFDEAITNLTKTNTRQSKNITILEMRISSLNISTIQKISHDVQSKKYFTNTVLFLSQKQFTQNMNRATTKTPEMF